MKSLTQYFSKPKSDDISPELSQPQEEVQEKGPQEQVDHDAPYFQEEEPVDSVEVAPQHGVRLSQASLKVWTRPQLIVAYIL